MDASAALLPLPTGLWRDGRRHADLAFRSLTGADEDWLLSAEEAGLGPVEAMLGLAARCAVSLGDLAPVTAELLAALPLGDREAIALALRRQVLGGRLDALLACPAESCGEKLEVELPLAELLAVAPRHPAPTVALDLPAGRLRCRLPSSDDQRIAAAAAARGEDAVVALLDRCLDGGAAALPQGALPVLEAALADADPLAETELELRCPACGAISRAVLDATRFVHRELGAKAAALPGEVLRLAAAAHWTEAEILAMPRRRRRRYLRLLAPREAA